MVFEWLEMPFLKKTKYSHKMFNTKIFAVYAGTHSEFEKYCPSVHYTHLLSFLTWTKCILTFMAL